MVCRGRKRSARADWREKERAHRRPLLTAKRDGNGPRNIFGFLIEFYRWSPAFMVLGLACALIAWFAPNDALTRWPVPKTIATTSGEVY